jgi:hypothetical protein
MTKLTGKTRWLTVTRAPDLQGHLVQINDKFDESLKDWTGGTRISPIYPLTADTP